MSYTGLSGKHYSIKEGNEMSYTGLSGKHYSIVGSAMNKGGEGSIYRISELSNYVLKIFHEKFRTDIRHRKLLSMISINLSENAQTQIAWPIDIVYQNGKFAGYLMPFIANSTELNVIYSDKYESTMFERITIAMNLCVAINAVHEAGHICGDLNPRNIAVNPNSARVTLWDTDSFHIYSADKNEVFRCEVGLPEYLAKEITTKLTNGKTLITASLPTFTKSTDLFSLAIHIFALLMNGTHPFQCALDGGKLNIKSLSTWQSSVTLPRPIENISNGIFPFYHTIPGATIPVYAPSFDILPTNIQKLFIRTFVDGHSNPDNRTNTIEWYQALKELRDNLTHCVAEEVHMYPNHIKSCPWCTINQRLDKFV